MSDRIALRPTLDTLRATLARSERVLPLSGPVHSWDLYDRSIAVIESLTAEVQAAIDQHGHR